MFSICQTIDNLLTWHLTYIKNIDKNISLIKLSHKKNEFEFEHRFESIRA